MSDAGEGPVLVLGATSLVGRFLTPRLAAAGIEAVAFSRAPRDPLPGVRWVVGDLTHPATLAAIGPVARVFSLSPIWLLPPALEAVRGLGMRRLVAFSSTSVMTKAGSTSPQERAVVQALAAGEAAVAGLSDHGVGWTVLRPTLIYAEGLDGNVSRLAGLIRRLGVLPLPGAAAGLRQPVHADDLAAVALAAMARAPSDRAYAVAGGDTLTYRAMVERIFEGMGRRPHILTLPPPLVRLGYAVTRPLLPGATAEMIGRIEADLVFDDADARRDLGWAPRGFRPRF